MGSVEDERFFSALGFLQSKVRNKLDKNLENFLRLYTSRYEINTFPYRRALNCGQRNEKEEVWETFQTMRSVT